MVFLVINWYGSMNLLHTLLYVLAFPYYLPGKLISLIRKLLDSIIPPMLELPLGDFSVNFDIRVLPWSGHARHLRVVTLMSCK